MGQKEFRTRITLLVQAKIFVDRRNKGDMIKLVACLERERVTRWDVITKINYSLARILSSKLIKDYGGQNNNVEAQPLVSFSYMIGLWDSKLEFTLNME